MIKTPRLLLRPFRREDAEALFEIFGDPAVMAYWSTPPHADLAETAELVEATITADPAHTAEFIVEHEGRVIGKAGFWAIPEIGALLHPDFWSKGFGTELVEALLDYGFGTLDLDQVTADVDPRNAASLKVLARTGFVETGREKNTMKVAGTWVDSVYLARHRHQKSPPD